MNLPPSPEAGPHTPAGRRLADRIPPLLVRLRGPALDALGERLAPAEAQDAEVDPFPFLPREPWNPLATPMLSSRPARRFLTALVAEGRRLLEVREAQEDALRDFRAAVRRAPDEITLRALLGRYVRTLSPPRRIRGDLRALKRWLDADAIEERYRREIEARGVELELVCHLLRDHDLDEPATQLLLLLMEDPRLPTRRAAYRALFNWATRRLQQRPDSLSTDLQRTLLDLALDRTLDPPCGRRAQRLFLGLQAETRQSLVMDRLAPDPLELAARAPSEQAVDTEQRDAGPPPEDAGIQDLPVHLRGDFLIRAETARIAIQAGGELARRAYDLARRDPSETVRSGLARGLALRGDLASRVQLERLAAEDPSPAVRTRAELELAELDAASLADEEGAGGEARHPEDSPGGEPDTGDATSDEGFADALARDLAPLAPGRSRTLTLPPGEDPVDLARALLPHVRTDYGFALAPRWRGRIRVTRGDRPVLRLWRLLWESRTPHSAKRQAGNHLTGRTAPGSIRVPPRRLAEVNPTGVPGQRVAVEPWGWAPWLPLPEDCFDALGRRRLVMVTEEGVTHVHPPASPLTRLGAALVLSWTLPSLWERRLHCLEVEDPPDRAAYVHALRRYGFRLSFEPAESSPTEAAQAPPAGIGDFFPGNADEKPAGLPAPGPGSAVLMGGPLTETLRSLLGDRHNRPVELAGFVVAMVALFLGRLVVLRHRVRRARRRLPLVIGGWGTRGKSGTERLKAAVFHGLGVDAFCKTTGCEAMALHAPPGREPLELYLYRPFERATIWEHAEVLEHASRLETPVFLWECMALRPDYVEQLQRYWTRDDLSTITNTYPDHEDIQGPSGLDVADVIADFTPHGRCLLTTEDQMIPLLRERARRRNTEVRWVDSRAVTAMPSDLMERIPYHEHPANVALVARLSEDLGLDPEEAVFWMGEHVVTDLGALVTWPPMRHRGRELEFTNGMSANERTGFLNNWNRAGFAVDPQRFEPDTFYLTVVNNRRDRVPRSRIFARILVRDAPAHRHVLVGTNLEGMRRFVDEELTEFLEEEDLFGGGSEGVPTRLLRWERRLRLVHLPDLLRATAARLGIPWRQVDETGSRLRSLLLDAPAEPLTLEQARELLAPVRSWLEELALSVGGTFSDTDTASLTPGEDGRVPGVFPDLSPPLFHDDEDLERGIEGLVEAWLAWAEEELAFRSLWYACSRESSREEPTPVQAWDDEEPTTRTSPSSGEPRCLLRAGPRREPRALETSEQARLAAAGKALYRELFHRRLVTVADPEATGDQLMDHLSCTCPAGSRLRIMGVQNIKGTGLDLVYRWHFSREPLQWSEQLFHPDLEQRKAALKGLRRWQEWSIPTCQEVLRALRAMPPHSATNAMARQERDRLEEALDRHRRILQRRRRTWSGIRIVRNLLWRLWDPLDAILRRWTADRVWRDLTLGRIAHERAAHELRRLTLRQRGEHLAEDPEQEAR